MTTLSDLMNIQVGKRYLCVVRAWEKECPHCHHVFGSEMAGLRLIVRVLRKALRGSTCLKCGGYTGGNNDGYYFCETDRGQFLIPYTQLSRIAEEDYD